VKIRDAAGVRIDTEDAGRVVGVVAAGGGPEQRAAKRCERS